MSSAMTAQGGVWGAGNDNTETGYANFTGKYPDGARLHRYDGRRLLCCQKTMPKRTRKISIKDLQQDRSTKAETQAFQVRVSQMEEYRDDTVDRLARIEEQMKGFKDQTQALNASNQQLISTLKPSR